MTMHGPTQHPPRCVAPIEFEGVSTFFFFVAATSLIESLSKPFSLHLPSVAHGSLSAPLPLTGSSIVFAALC